jgi:putative transposase
LGSYELFQRASLLEETVWHKIMHGLSMRSYKEVVQQFAEAYRLEKSTISERFVQASRTKLEQLMKRTLQHVSLIAMYIDVTVFKGENLIVAPRALIGPGVSSCWDCGRRHRECDGCGRTAGGNWRSSGVDFNAARLYIVDGGKAIRKDHHQLCRGSGVSATLLGAQSAERLRVPAGREAAGHQVPHASCLSDKGSRRCTPGATG